MSVCAALALSACAPVSEQVTNVTPSLFSVTAPPEQGGTLVLQGRYFGDGADGQRPGSYVLLGGDINGNSGVRVKPGEWTPSRIALSVPEGVGYGYVFVVVDGVRSNGLPANLP